MSVLNKNNTPDFIRRQYEFTAFIRDPQKNPRPSDIEQRRMNIYSELFYNNVEGFMSNSYPVLKSIYGEKLWHKLIRDYFSNHLAHTPLFPEMPREFLKYLENERVIQDDDPIFLLELAHYEWVELALTFLDQDTNLNNVNPKGNLLEAHPVMSSLAWSLTYIFPVHKISPEFQPAEKPEQPTYIIVYRNIDDEIVFMELNPVTARLVQLINKTNKNDNQKNGRDYLIKIAQEMNHPNPDVVIEGGLQAMQELRTRNILLGTIKN